MRNVQKSFLQVRALPAVATDRILTAVDSIIPFHIHALLHFDGHLDTGRLQTAVSRLLVRIPITRGILRIGTPFGFRCRWDTGVIPPPELIITSSENSGGTTPEEDPVIVEFVNSRLDILKTPPIRMLLMEFPDSSGLLIKFHHSLLDGKGLLMLLNDLRNCYLAPREGSGDAPPIENRGMFQLYRKAGCKNWPWILARQFQVGRENLFTRYQNLEFESPANLQKSIEPPARLRWRRIKLNPQETGRLRDRAHRLGGTVNDLLLSAGIRMTWQHNGSPPGPGRDYGVNMAVNLREAFGIKGVRANLSGTETIAVPVSQLSSPQQTMHRVCSQTSRLKSRFPGLAGMLFFSVLGRVLPHSTLVWFFRKLGEKILAPDRLGSAVTNVGVIDPALHHWGNPFLTDISLLAPCISPWGYLASASTFRDEITVNLGYLDRYITPEIAGKLVGQFRKELTGKE